jgi:hypothetical protein
MRASGVLLSLILTSVMSAATGFAAEKYTYQASLSGREEVPGVETQASGETIFAPDMYVKEVNYRLSVKDIENTTSAHIHEGKMGKGGPVVVVLFTGPKKAGNFTGVLAEGIIREKDLAGSLKGKPLDALIKLIEAGDAYVNVHTDGHPGGEIRGQIK